MSQSSASEASAPSASTTPSTASSNPASHTPMGACPHLAGATGSAGTGARGASGASTTPTDDGYFGPGSVSWRLYSDPSSKLGGAASILLQSLNPMMMRVFNGASSYTEDVEGRAERTGQYVDTTIFGDRAHADAAGAAVQRLHAHSTWTDPRTGEELRADNEEWLAWTHNAIVYGVLRAADEFGPNLTRAEQDQFVTEQHQAAHIVGITDQALLPATRTALDQYISDNRDWMALTLPAAEISRVMRKPNLKGNPIKVWVELNVQDAILGLLPDWALLLFGIEGRPMNIRAATRVTRKLIASARAGRSSADLIAEVSERVHTHPYRKVRGAR